MRGDKCFLSKTELKIISVYSWITLYIETFRCVQTYNKDQSGISILHRLETLGLLVVFKYLNGMS